MTVFDIAETYNEHAGSTFILVGNGPSLNQLNFDSLKKFKTIGLNRIAKIYRRQDWMPSYFVCTTINVAQPDWRKDIQTSVDLGIPTLIGTDLVSLIKDTSEARLYPTKTFAGMSVGKEDDSELWSDDLSHGVSKFGTSIIVAAQWAVYMGAAKIAFVGCDLGFKRSIIQRFFYRFGFKRLGNRFDQSHFDSSYGTPGGHGDFFNRNMTLAHRVIRRQCERRGVEVYNCTPGGTLEVYDRLNLDDL